jgi:hypothetical protein
MRGSNPARAAATASHLQALRVLLLRAGDIESNPGPNPQIITTKLLEALRINDANAKRAMTHITTHMASLGGPHSPVFRHAMTIVDHALGPVDSTGIQGLLACDVTLRADHSFDLHKATHYPMLYGTGAQQPCPPPFVANSIADES